MSHNERPLPDPDATMVLEDGRVLAWDEHGPPDGQVAIYMHGSPSCRILWSGFESMARQAGVRLIMPDRPGCGASSFQSGRSIVDWPSDVVALADHLELEQYYVIGASGGGPYSLACAVAGDPRILRAAVTSGVGPLDTAEAISRLNDVNRGIFEAAAAGAESVMPVMSALAAGPSASGGSMADLITTLPPEDQAVIRRHPGMMEEMVDFGAAATQGVEGLAYDLWLLTQPWGFDLGKIDIEVDFYAGDHDQNVPLQHLVDQAARVPRSTLTVWPAAGHVEQTVRLPEVLTRLTRKGDAG